MSIVVVTFKEEDRDDRAGPVGPWWSYGGRESESHDESAARQAGVPFAYKPGEATDLGWKTRREAVAIAADHGVALTDW